MGLEFLHTERVKMIGWALMNLYEDVTSFSLIKIKVFLALLRLMMQQLIYLKKHLVEKV